MMKRLLTLCLAMMLGSSLFAGPVTVRGINLLSADEGNDRRAIDAAAAGGANHVQLSHRIVHSLCELDDPIRRELAGSLASHAHEAGIGEVCIWDHALYDTDYYPHEFYYPGTGLLDLDSEGLWQWIKADYRRLLSLCPDVDGLVLTFVESGARIEDQFGSMDVPHRLAKVINTVSEVVCGELGKSLWLRTFAYNEAEYANISECFALLDWHEGMGLMVKDVPHDFLLHHPDNPFIGRLGHPVLVEFDACGEYNGQSVILNAMPGYFAERWRRYMQIPEVCGYVARTSRCGDDEITGTPAEVNLYALRRVSEDPQLSAEDVLREFVQMRYGPGLRQRDVRRLMKAFGASRDIIEGSMYILNLNTTHHSDLRLDDPSTYSRHCSGRWTESEYVRLGHGVGRRVHWWRDLANTLAPVSCKTLDGKRAEDIRNVLDAGWLTPEEAMTEEYLDYVVRWTDDCLGKARKGYRQLQKCCSRIDAEAYEDIADIYERSLMCLELRQAAAVCYWGARVWARGEAFRSRSLERRMRGAFAQMESVLAAYDSYCKPYPVGTWDWKSDAAVARTYRDEALNVMGLDQRAD